MNTVVAGTVFRGMFEDRIEKVIAEVKERRNIILFVDERTRWWARAPPWRASDAGEHLQVGAGPREVQIIGATTARIQGDRAGGRGARQAVRVVKIGEPTLDETREILMGSSPPGGELRVTILDEAIDFALSMPTGTQGRCGSPTR